MSERMKHIEFKNILPGLFIFIFSLFFCYFAAVKNLIYSLGFLVAVFALFERVKTNELFLLKVVSPFFVVPLAFYNWVLGILALVFVVIAFSAIYILRHVKKINVKKLRRVFFLSLFLIYLFIPFL